MQAQNPPLRRFTESRPAMGSSFTIHLYAEDQARAARLMEMAFDEIERVEEELSNYRAGSELSRINRLAAQQAVTTDGEVFGLLRLSLDYSRRSDGAFDITVGPLMRAWGFFRGEGRYPKPEELAAARAATGWRNVILDEQNRTVRFTRAGVELDPGGIGKGYAVDRVIGLLREAGVQSALVDAASSSMAAMGTPPGEPGWLVHVPRPGNRAQFISSVLLRDNALTTSGNYEKFFRIGDRTYCHIMDPRTGQPVQGVLQATVVTPDATSGEALSKVAFVLGPERGRQFLETVPGARALWVVGEAAAPRTVAWKWQRSAPAAGATGARSVEPHGRPYSF